MHYLGFTVLRCAAKVCRDVHSCLVKDDRKSEGRGCLVQHGRYSIDSISMMCLRNVRYVHAACQQYQPRPCCTTLLVVQMETEAMPRVTISSNDDMRICDVPLTQSPHRFHARRVT